jgi:vancomycin resistance protein YoaR
VIREGTHECNVDSDEVGVRRSAIRRALEALALALAIVGAIGIVGAASLRRWWPLVLPGAAGRALPGLRLEGSALVEGGDVRAQVEADARALLSRRIRFVTGLDGPNDAAGARGVVAEASLAELGVSIDVDASVARAMSLGRTGDVSTRASDAERARRGSIDVPLVRSFEPRAVFARLAPFKEDLDAPPVPARLDLRHKGILPERPGRALDLDAAAAAVERASLGRVSGRPGAPGPSAPGVEAFDIDLPFVAVPASVTHEALARIDVSHVLAAFDTYFSRRGDQEPRARNIEVAASHIDGLVLRSGQVESFNAVVGPRSEDNGFFKAFEIFKGEYVEGMGGGTCQVASTVHAVAFYGGLDIVERLPHSRPSAYIPTGLDATVVYPTVDLKIRNPFPFAVAFHTTVGPNTLHVELLGARKPVSVELQKEELSTTPFERKVVEDRAFAQPKRTQKGADGLELRRLRVLTYARGSRRVESTVDRYPPTLEVWKVPPGFDEDSLPPLGEDPPSTDATSPAPSSTTAEPARI